MKTEKKKMLNGELYNAADPELIKERLNARRLTRLYTQTLETDINKRTVWFNRRKSLHRTNLPL